MPEEMKDNVTYTEEATAALNFSRALAALKEGAKVAREGWNGKGMWIRIKPCSQDGEMTDPYIYMKTVDDRLVPWLASQTDLLAKDWEIVE